MRKGLIVFLFLLFISFHLTTSIEATPEYVDECLENPENCEETTEDEAELEINDSDSGFLIESDNSTSLFVEIVKLIFALLLVLLIIYLFLYFLKRRNKLGGQIRSLEVIGGISIAQNKSIQLIRFDKTLYIVGIGEDITLIDQINDEALIEKIIEEKNSQGQAFTTIPFVESFLNKKNKQEPDDDQFKNLFQKEMEDLQRNRKNILKKRKEDHYE